MAYGEQKYYADISDIETRIMHAISDDKMRYVEAMISDASAYIDEFVQEYVASEPSDTIKKRVCADLVAAWYSTASIPAGAESISQSAGEVSQSVNFGSSGSASARSPWWLSREQKRMLGMKETWGSIQMVPDGRYI